MSKRGLVIANRHGETVLFEHPRAARLPVLLAAAVSLLAGLALIAVSVAIQWHVLGGLLTALATGSITDILTGCYLIIPIALAALTSLTGLILQTVIAPPRITDRGS